jgi:transposase
MAHIIGQSRYQATLYPEVLDEVIAPDSAVRVIDAFVDSLDLAGLGFSKVDPEATGRPPYDPRDLLKLYVYGYLNQMRSSRRLEREAQRNVEVFWLINRVARCSKPLRTSARIIRRRSVGCAGPSLSSVASSRYLALNFWRSTGRRLRR